MTHAILNSIIQSQEFVFAMRLLLAVLLSSLIGIERERNDKPAGVRTAMLICLGATLITLFSLRYADLCNALNYKTDALRAIAYYLVGWGFLGGGIINREEKKHKIEGITTASLLLPLCIIGFLCGIGDIILACISTLLIYFILIVKYIQIKFKQKGLENVEVEKSGSNN